MAHFCSKTGTRIAKPGVSKAVDPENGHDEVELDEDGAEVLVGEGVEAPKAKGKPSKFGKQADGKDDDGKPAGGSDGK